MNWRLFFRILFWVLLVLLIAGIAKDPVSTASAVRGVGEVIVSVLNAINSFFNALFGE